MRASDVHVSAEHRQTRQVSLLAAEMVRRPGFKRSAALHGVGKLKNVSYLFSDSMESFLPERISKTSVKFHNSGFFLWKDPCPN